MSCEETKKNEGQAFSNNFNNLMFEQVHFVHTLLMKQTHYKQAEYREQQNTWNVTQNTRSEDFLCKDVHCQWSEMLKILSPSVTDWERYGTVLNTVLPSRSTVLHLVSQKQHSIKYNLCSDSKSQRIWKIVCKKGTRVQNNKHGNRC